VVLCERAQLSRLKKQTHLEGQGKKKEQRKAGLLMLTPEVKHQAVPPPSSQQNVRSIIR